MFDSIWYDNLIKPVLNPPSWVFPPVWIMLYASILASLIIYSIKITKKPKANGYILFIIQMLLNLAWSPTFFGLQDIKTALIIVILLDIFVFLTALKFFSISKTAGAILIPYVIWIFFATYLNIGFLVLN